jgi:hypothetical protein
MIAARRDNGVTQRCHAASVAIATIR